MVISESKKRVMISLTKEQKKLTDMAKQKGFSKSAVAALAIEEYARKESEQKNKRKLAFLEGYEFFATCF
ncbi:CopG family transcriptional regulator (plasmid) [Lactococcus lactis subsp. lactis]|nr:CopG family transcriptional regulator [Lactococcus lactis subsp. lactis]